MTKELFVSSTPHENKVGLVEDDQLDEIYPERENEYTLAGSIYKGRVTRVLPGMQSAFVDIGLERDAFLYVSDFMDLEQQDEDLDEAIAANRPATDGRPSRASESGPQMTEGDAGQAESDEFTSENGKTEETSAETSGSSEGSRDRGGFRGRRRRRGRRGDRPERGERSAERPERTVRDRAPGAAEPRFHRSQPPTARPIRGDYEYGPPPGYQPIILPGE